MSTVGRNTVSKHPLSIVIFGASGDLAKKKTYPALFSLYYHGLLPSEIQIIGFGRSHMTDQELRDKALCNLTCRLDVVSHNECSEAMEEFTKMCTYKVGNYSIQSEYAELKKSIDEFESAHGGRGNRLFYLAIPPEVFIDSIRNISSVFQSTTPSGCWLRTVVEKPFGYDLKSFRKLSNGMKGLLRRDQVYRIDHFLGKELVQNIMVLRFANQIFEPSWNREYIQSVQITFKEDFGVEGRGGFFDKAGIIRDVMQNHLLQVLTLIAMEPPSSLDAEDVRFEKVKTLKAISYVPLNDFVLGQYTGDSATGKIGYKEEKEVSKSSITPTLAACVLHVRNRRWDGVPFFMLAGKAMSERKSEVRICFKKTPGHLFPSPPGLLDHNELIIRIQPRESIKLRLVHKIPGLQGGVEDRTMSLYVTDEEVDGSPTCGGRKKNANGFNIDYNSTNGGKKQIPDAYEPLILDVLSGNDEHFICERELDEAWRIFTPALFELEGKPIDPEIISSPVPSMKFKSPNGSPLLNNPPSSSSSGSSETSSTVSGKEGEIKQPSGHSEVEDRVNVDSKAVRYPSKTKEGGGRKKYSKMLEYEYGTEWLPELDKLTSKFSCKWGERIEVEFRQIKQKQLEEQERAKEKQKLERHSNKSPESPPRLPLSNLSRAAPSSSS